MITEFRRGLLFTLASMAIVGLYHVAIWGVGRVAFPVQADGSLIRTADGTIVGSSLLAQKFERAEYFQPRPSAVDYNAASTGGSNFGPSNPDHLKAVAGRLRKIEDREGVTPAAVPSEMVTASGSGLDPHIPPAAVEFQLQRVAGARGVTVDRVRDIVAAHTEPPTLGFLGAARVNVLELNLALDAAFGHVIRRNDRTE